MATGARTKLSQQQGSGKCMTLGPRRMICTTLLGILLFRLLLSQSLEYYRSTIRTRERPQLSGFEFEGSGENSSEKILRFSQFNPALLTERERIKFFLKATNFGQISVQQILYPKDFRTIPAKRRVRTPRVRAPAERAWMLPFAVKSLQAYMPDVVKLSNKWVGDNGDFNPQVMQDLLQAVKGPLNRNAAYWSRTLGLNGGEDVRWGYKYRSCAVVGNSGILLNGSYGQQIDSHEMVIRLNNAGIYPYTEHVGSKTNLSFINSNIMHSCSVIPECWCHPYGKEVPIVLYICQANHMVHVARCMSHHRSPIVVTHSLFDALCQAIVKWYSVTNFVQTTGRPVSEWNSVHAGDYFHYSSGMQAVVLALGICDSVDMFGFGKSPHAKHHYHTAQTEELTLHDYAAEYLFYDDLVHNRTIPFVSDAGISVPPVRIFF